MLCSVLQSAFIQLPQYRFFLFAERFPEDYQDRFARCAADYEEAVYSGHTVPEEKRQNALELLKETENDLWKASDWKQRLYLKYWMCLVE